MATLKTTKAFEYWLLDGIVLLLPTYLLRWQVLGIRFNGLDVVIAVAFLICLMRYRRMTVGHWGWAMLAFLVIGAIATWVSPDHVAALGLFKSYCVAPVLVAIMLLTIRPPLERLTRTFALLTGYISIVALLQYATHYGVPAPWNVTGPEYRVTSVFDYPNAVGLLLAPLVVWLLTSAWQRQSQRWWLVTVSVLGMIAIVLSRSDGAMVAVVIGILVALCGTRWRWLVLTVAGSSLIIAFMIPATRAILLLQDTSGQVRLVLWQGTLTALYHHPWFGAGLGGFPALYAQYKLTRHVELLLYPHNIFLDFWIEFGLLGLIWLGLTLIWFFVTAGRVRSSQSRVIMATMVCILIYGLVDVPYFKNDLAVLFWIILTANALLVE